MKIGWSNQAPVIFILAAMGFYIEFCYVGSDARHMLSGGSGIL